MGKQQNDKAMIAATLHGMRKRRLDSLDWFVVAIVSNIEKKVSTELRRAGFRVYRPASHTPYRHRTKGAQVKTRPLLMGYLFVRFPPALIFSGVPVYSAAMAVNFGKGVRGFVLYRNGAGELVPFIVPRKIVSDFMDRQRRREFGSPEPEDAGKRAEKLREIFKPGKRVTITNGTLEGYVGILRKLTEGGDLALDVYAPTDTKMEHPRKVTIEAEHAVPAMSVESARKAA